MTLAIARAVMRLATRCLGVNRPEWARAMQGEFQAAIEDGQPLAFAAGCLLAAFRQMPTQEQGRFVLANYVLALGLFVPMAALHLTCAAGFPSLPLGQVPIMAPGGIQQLYLSDAYPGAAPALLAVWLLLGASHLRLAWVLLERDWPRVVQAAALIVAASATQVIFTVVLFLNGTGVGLEIFVLAVEMAVLHVSACWHDRLFPDCQQHSLAGF